MLNADYGRVLLVDKRPKEAQPVLEQAVKDAPDFGDAWINLAWARLQNGDSDAACAAADVAMKQRPSSNASVDLDKLRNDCAVQVSGRARISRYELFTVLRALFQLGKRSAGEAAEIGRGGVELFGMIGVAGLERGEPAAEARKFIRWQL